MIEKKIVIHQPSKYGDFINVMPIVQKLMNNGYDVWFPHCSTTKELLKHFPDVKTFEIGCVDSNTSGMEAKKIGAKLINCQTNDKYSSLCTIHGGNLFIEELKYYIVNDNVDIEIKYENKYKLTWKRNTENENNLFKLLNINNNEEYVITHTVGDNGRVGIVPKSETRRRIEIVKLKGYTLLDWYVVILKSQAVYMIQSSAQCFVDCIKYSLNNKTLYLLNDTSNPERLLVPAYDWNFEYFINNRFK